MTDTQKPLLVYERVAANKRQTWLLLAAFPLVVLPFVAAISRGFLFAFLEQIGRRAHALYELMSYPRHVPVPSLARLPAVTMAGSLVVASLTIILAAAFVISRYGSHVVLRLARATPLDPDRERELGRIAENLCIGAGLPVPSIYVVDSAAPNAFATGNNPDRAALVVTRGLLTLLDRRELEGVIAHELSHIGNQDIRLTTTLAALVSMALLPFTALRRAWELAKGFGVVVLFAVFEGLFGWVHIDVCKSRTNSRCDASTG